MVSIARSCFENMIAVLSDTGVFGVCVADNKRLYLDRKQGYKSRKRGLFRTFSRVVTDIGKSYSSERSY